MATAELIEKVQQLAEASAGVAKDLRANGIRGGPALASVCQRYANRLQRACAYAQRSGTFLGRGTSDSAKRRTANRRNAVLGGQPPRRALINALPNDNLRAADARRIEKAPARFLAAALQGRSIKKAVLWLRTPDPALDGPPIELDVRLKRQLGEREWARVKAARTKRMRRKAARK